MKEMMMKNLLLSTAALAGFMTTTLASPATAQDTATDMFREASDAMSIRASDFIGMRVYASEGAIDSDAYDGMQDGWADVGEVNDVILSRNGSVDAVLVDVGGFLGMGERQVAIGMESIRFVADNATADAPDDFFLVMSAAKSDFEAAPEYMADDAAVMNDGVAADTTAMDDTAAAEMTREPTARDGFVVAEADFLTAEKLSGAAVYDSNDDRIGEVKDLLLTADGVATQAVIDVGGFLGMGEKPVALDLAQIDILREDAGEEVRVYVAMTKEQLESLPAYEAE
jgi:sporulation protein YlmC with PRC-barrel domain